MGCRKEDCNICLEYALNIKSASCKDDVYEMDDMTAGSTKFIWEITPQKVENAIKKIIAVSHPKKLILFGSYISGTININSDLDFLVITGDNIGNPRKESIRIRRSLKGIFMPIDILVVPESKLNKLAKLPGLIYREALTKGKVVYDSTS